MNRLQRANLEYVREADGPGIAGRVLLGIGVISVMVMAVYASQIQRQSLTLEADLVRIKQPRWELGKSKVSPANSDQVKSVQSAMAALVLPWEPLFQALEKMDADGVKMIAVEPDARRRSVRITAEATESDGMLDYITLLGKQPMLKDVFLVSQERQSEAEIQSIRFVVDAAWVPAP